MFFIGKLGNEMRVIHVVMLIVLFFSSSASAVVAGDEQIKAASEQIEAMRITPIWQNATLAKRKALFDEWISEKYIPYIMSFQDVNVRTALFLLPERTLKQDIINLEKTCKDSKLPNC